MNKKKVFVCVSVYIFESVCMCVFHLASDV